MLTTTMSVLALAATLSTGASPSPGWQTDYAQAMTVATAERKPMAVFIGQGSDKIGHMIADGSISGESARLLRESYVCVYLNTDTSVGKEMATRFDLPEGLVISSPGGGVQALRHEGSIAGSALTRQLGQYATAGQPITTVTTTASSSSGVITGTIVPVSHSAPVYLYGGCPNGNCGLSAYPSTSYAYPSANVNPFGNSSCPNGRCPNQR